MKKIISLLVLFSSVVAWGSPITMDVLNAPQGLTITTQRGSYIMPNGFVTNELISTATDVVTLQNKTFDQTSNLKLLDQGTFDVSVNGASAQTIGLLLPKGAIITKAYWDVITAVTGPSGAIINISLKSFGDLLTNYNINLATVGSTALTFSAGIEKLTAPTAVTIDLTGTGGALTAGKFRVFVDYMISP